MVEPIGDWPDFTRVTLIVGKDAAGNPVGVFVDSVGNLAAILKGQKPDTALATVALDAAGRIIMVPYGTTEVSGTATVTQAAKDREVQGADGATLRTLAVDASGQLVMVPRGQSGNYMAIDASGFMTAILKGAYAGDLHTMAVDAAGRLEAFILDSQSQWGDVLRIGNAELASRLGSAKSWDWRGDLVYFNDFSRGLGNILKYYNGTGSGIALDPTYWVNGGYSLKLTGGSDGAGDAYIDVLIDHPPSRKLGLEVHVSGDISFEYLYIRLEVRIGAWASFAGLKLLPPGAPDVLYLNDANAWVKIGDSYFGTVPESFNHLKIVADFDTGYYLRALWGHTEYDLSAQAVYKAASSYLDQIYARIYLKSTAASNQVRYIDYVAVTVGEPDNA